MFGVSVSEAETPIAPLPAPAATQLVGLAFLLALAVSLGYATACVRGSRPGKRLLSKLGYRLQPEGSMYSQTLFHMSDEATVMVELKDGRRVWAYPRRGPYYKDDGINELYLLYPKCEDDHGDWQPVGGPGLIIPLSEVCTVLLFEEPTARRRMCCPLRRRSRSDIVPSGAAGNLRWLPGDVVRR